MSLIQDLNRFSEKTFYNVLAFFTSVLILAVVLMFVLPDLLTRKSKYNIDSINVKQQIEHQVENTKLHLIFRTRSDLANRLGVPQQDIALNGTTNREWTDTSLECPSPHGGTALVQIPQRATIPGWLITWKLGNTIYEYNTSVRGDWVLCSKIEIPKDIFQYRSPADK